MAEDLKPNIIYMHCHDLGRFIAPYGYAVNTPNLQRFAESSVVFRKAFCASPTCSPSRAALVTGLTPHSSGMLGLSTGTYLKSTREQDFALNDYKQHMLHTLKQHGYFTALSGLQHIDGPIENGRPYGENIGYDTVLTEKDMNHAFDIKRVDERAIEFFAKEHTKPFYLEIGFNETHSHTPWPNAVRPDEEPQWCLPPAPLPDSPEIRKDISRLKASARILDEQIGKVLDGLKEYKLDENTFVFITTDHGLGLPNMKCNLFDNGTSVFLMMRGPGQFNEPQIIEPMVTHMDIFPTLCEYLQIEKPSWLQGESLLPLVEGKTDCIHETIFSEINYHNSYVPQRAARTERWKYIENHHTNATQDTDPTRSKRFLERNPPKNENRPAAMLFDLIHDPYETNNLANSPHHTVVLSDMAKRLHQWMRDTNDPLLEGMIPPPVPGRFGKAPIASNNASRSKPSIH